MPFSFALGLSSIAVRFQAPGDFAGPVQPSRMDKETQLEIRRFKTGRVETTSATGASHFLGAYPAQPWVVQAMQKVAFCGRLCFGAGGYRQRIAIGAGDGGVGGHTVKFDRDKKRLVMILNCEC